MAIPSAGYLLLLWHFAQLDPRSRIPVARPHLSTTTSPESACLSQVSLEEVELIHELIRFWRNWRGNFLQQNNVLLYESSPVRMIGRRDLTYKQWSPQSLGDRSLLYALLVRISVVEHKPSIRRSSGMDSISEWWFRVLPVPDGESSLSWSGLLLCCSDMRVGLSNQASHIVQLRWLFCR